MIRGKRYGTSVGNLANVSTVIGTIPKFHTGGLVSDSNLGNDETLAVLQKGEFVFTKAQFESVFGGRGMGMIDRMIGRLTSSAPISDKVVESITNNTDNSSSVYSPIEIKFEHTGIISESDLKRYYDKAADVAIGKINEAFGKNGVVNNKVSRLRQ